MQRKSDKRPAKGTSTLAERNVRIYQQHGLKINWNGTDKEAVTVCPFCMKGQKFYIDAKTSCYDCKICGESGNGVSFLRNIYSKSLQATDRLDYKEITLERNLLFESTAGHFGLARSTINNRWLIPAYNTIACAIKTVIKHTKKYFLELLKSHLIHNDNYYHYVLMEW